MTIVCLNIRAHIRPQLGSYSFFDIGQFKAYIDEKGTRETIDQLCDKYYLPNNNQLLTLIQQYPDKMKVSYTISGTTLELLEKYRPEVLRTFRILANTGNVEFVCQPYYNSLGTIDTSERFKYEVNLHRNKIKDLFGQETKVIGDTQLVYNHRLNDIAKEMGFSGIIGKSSELLEQGINAFKTSGDTNIKCLLNSDHIINDWEDWSFKTVNENWAKPVSGKEGLLNLFMDFEDLVTKQQPSFYDHFFAELPTILNDANLSFCTLSEAMDCIGCDVLEEENVLNINGRELSVKNGNYMQKDAINKLNNLEKLVRKSGNINLNHEWCQLHDYGHFQAMNTFYDSRELNGKASNQNSPYDYYIHFMNIIADLELRLNYTIEMDELQNETDTVYLKSA